MNAISSAVGSATVALVDGFVAAAARAPQSPALVVGGESVSYGALLAGARRAGEVIDGLAESRFVAVLGVGTRAVFESILGVLLSGRAYVPLNPSFPASRTVYMLEASGADVLLVDSAGAKGLPEVLASLSARPAVVVAGDVDLEPLRSAFPDFRFESLAAADGADGEAPAERAAPAARADSCVPAAHPASPDDPAYLMFTSGSTGKPKGVVVSHANATSFVQTVSALYDFRPDDRFSQMFDLTFDLSVFDMFVCWQAGASLWVVPPRSRMAPAAFIRRSELTVWFSVPAVGAYMNQLGQLRRGNFPTLRYSLFCGEPLPVTVVRHWRAAAPDSTVDNLYGPTELTIACAWHRWADADSERIAVNDVVPIGSIYAGLEAAIVDGNLERVEAGGPGELCVRGPQTTPGYFGRPDLTEQKFVSMPWYDGVDNRWYRTGDVVRVVSGTDMAFIGRVDNQVKIRGYRVELGEIEARLREFGRTDFAIAVPWPVAAGGSASGLVACLSGSDVGDAELIAACAAVLPEYMVPASIHRVSRMPLNANGKIDRNALARMVQEASER